MKRMITRLAVLTAALMLLLPGTARAEGTQKASTSVQIMIYGNKNNVEFQVKGENGAAIKGASIDIRNGKAEWLFYGTTDSNGMKQLWMPLATQNYRVYKAGYETAQGSFTVRNLLSRTVVKVTLKKTKTPDPTPDPKPTPKPDPKPTPKPTPKPGGGTDNTNGGNSGGNESSTGGSSSSNSGSTTGGGGSASENSSSKSDGESTSPEDNENEKENPSRDDEKELLPKEDGTSDANGTDNGINDRTDNRAEEADSNYMERVDLAINVYKTDGSPAAGVKVELHSKIWTGELDENGFILFRGVEIGNHEDRKSVV